MKVVVWQMVQDTAIGAGRPISLDVSWPDFLSLPGPGDILGLGEEEHNVRQTSFWPDQTDDLAFAYIYLETISLDQQDEPTLEEFVAKWRPGWRI